MNILTIDLEDWYQPLFPDPERWSQYEDRVERPTDELLKIFKDAGISVTFFCLGYIAEHHPALIERIAKAGHEIASHGYYHRFVYQQTPPEFEEDLQMASACLQKITGEKPVGYRAPYFSITEKSLWALDILRRNGFKYDSSIVPVINHRYGIPGAPRLPYQRAGILELPPSSYPAGGTNIPCAGGVYFRIFPYRLQRFFFAKMQQRKEPIVFYLHPWELDYDQPRVRVASPFLRVRHYWGLQNTGSKMRRLLEDFAFTSVRKARNL